MQSKTSFFNKTLYRQSAQLALPVFISMGITWLLSYTMPLFNELYGSYNGWKTTDDLTYLLWRSSENALQTITVPSLIFGLLLAVTLFHYLNTPRSVNMFHALPLRREGLFWTQYAVGVSCIVLSLGMTALSVIALQATTGMICWELIFTWLWMAIVTTVFFFSFAVFCMMFAGVTWAGAAYYGIFNMVVLTVYSMYEALEQTFYYGTSNFATPRWVDWCTPVVNLQSGIGIEWDWTWVGDVRSNLSAYTIYGESIVLKYGLAAIALICWALAVYRRRPSESASDVVAISWAKPLFRFGMALCSGLILGFGLYLIVWDGFSTITSTTKVVMAVICMIVVSLVGLVVAEMLMEKTMRIGWKWLKSGAIMALLFVALGCVLEFDLFGTERYVPTVEDVGQVEVRMYGNSSSNLTVILDDPEEIATVIAMHQAIVNDKDRQQEPGFANYVDGYVSVSIRYYSEATDNMPLCYRSYAVFYAPEEVGGRSPLVNSIQGVLNLPQMQYAAIWQTADLSDWVDNMELDLYDATGEYQYTYQMTDAEMAMVYAALKQDAIEGHLSGMVLDPDWRESGYSNNLSMEIYSEETYYGNDPTQPAVETYSTWRNVRLNPVMTHTIAALESLETVKQTPLFMEVS